MLEFDKEQEVVAPKFKEVEEEEPKKEEPAELPTEAPAEEDGQFDLFGEPVDPKAVATGKVNKKPEPKPVVPKPAPKQFKPSSLHDDKKKVGTEYNIYYAGNVIQVPETDMDLEEVRKFLQVDFPEFSKERTELLVDHTAKEIRPIIKGSKKG